MIKCCLQQVSSERTNHSSHQRALGISKGKGELDIRAGVWWVQGRTYLCKKLDLGSKVAMVRAADLKYYTKTRDFTDVHVVGGRSAYPARVSNPHPRPPFMRCTSAYVPACTLCGVLFVYCQHAIMNIPCRCTGV